MLSRVEAAGLGGGLEGRSERTGGFAAVDALVGLTILATVISLAVAALASARRVAMSALETAQASAELRLLLSLRNPAPGVQHGRDGTFDWLVEQTASADAGPSQLALLCGRRAIATSIRTGRRYQMTTAAFCVRPEPRR